MRLCYLETVCSFQASFLIFDRQDQSDERLIFSYYWGRTLLCFLPKAPFWSGTPLGCADTSHSSLWCFPKILSLASHSVLRWMCWSLLCWILQGDPSHIWGCLLVLPSLWYSLLESQMPFSPVLSPATLPLKESSMVSLGPLPTLWPGSSHMVSWGKYRAHIICSSTLRVTALCPVLKTVHCFSKYFVCFYLCFDCFRQDSKSAPSHPIFSGIGYPTIGSFGGILILYPKTLLNSFNDPIF